MSKPSMILVRGILFGACASVIACSSDDSSPPAADSGAKDATSDGTAADGAPPVDSATEAQADGGADTGVADGTVAEAGDGSLADAAPDAGASDAGAEAATDGSAEAAATDGAVADSGVSSLAALPDYTVRVFATGGSTYKGPDSLALDGTTVWVGYQMGVIGKAGETDGGGPLNSMVVQYNLADGSLTGKSFSVAGHCDGVRVDPTSHVVWATSNEDGNPGVVSWNPTTSTTTTYTVAAPTAWGGGLDDLQFLPNGKIVVVQSSPSGASVPALSLMNVSGTAITFTPILMTDSMALNTVVVPAATQALAVTDPDSLTIDSQGTLMLVAQADQELIIIRNAGAAADAGDAGAQSVEVVPVSAQLDDTVWVTKATGMLLVADATANTIYSVQTTFVPGTVYTETPDDSNVPGILGIVDFSANSDTSSSRGFVRPVILGFKKATGLAFVPQ